MRHLAALALMLAGCAAQPPADTGSKEPAIPAAPPAVQRVQRQVLRTSWRFDSRTDECIAVAASGRASLQVTVRRDAPIRIAVSLPVAPAGSTRATAPLRFNGPAGRWQVTAQQTTGRQLSVILGSGEPALSRVLMMLSGGVVEIGEQDQDFPSLGLGPSESQGRQWFDCARSQLI